MFPSKSLYNELNLIKAFTFIEKKKLFSLRYPFDINSEPGFEIAYLFITIAGLLTTLTIASNEGQFTTLCMYITGQFQIVRLEIENLVQCELGTKLKFLASILFHSHFAINIFPGEYTYKNADFFTKIDNDKLLAKLSIIVQKHIDTIKLTNDMVNAFVPVIMVHFITAAITLCISCIGVMTVYN